MKKKFLLSLVLICISIFVLGTIGVSASQSGALYYKVSYGEKITITGCDRTATEIEIPESIGGKPVTKIGGDAFYGCKSLKSITISDSVTTIGEYAFYYCSSLTSVTIPKSVTVINSDAFYNSKNISTVYYNGTEDDWDEIYIYKGNDALTNATLKTICYIKLVDSDGKESTVTCLPDEKISLSDLEKTYKHKLTLYTDSAMTNEFDTYERIFDDMTLYVKLGEEITVIYGDLNGDGSVSVKDNMMLARYLAGWTDYDETTVALAAADLNGDGKVNVKDNMILARHLAEWPGYETLPVTD